MKLTEVFSRSLETQKGRLALLLGASILAFFPTLFIPFLHIDEGGWAAISREAFSGNLYRTITDHKPPFIFQLHYLATLGETSILGLRIFMILWTAFGGWSFFVLLKTYFRQSAAFFSAILFVLMSGLVNYGAFSIEHCYIPLLLFAGMLARQSSLKPHPQRKWICSLQVGLCLGAACLFKQTALLFAPVIFLILIAESLSEFSKIKIFRTIVFNFILVIVAALGITLVSWSVTGVPFQIIWAEGYLANLNYVAFDNQSAIGDILQNAFLILGIEYLPLVIGSIGGLIVLNQEYQKRRKNNFRWNWNELCNIALLVLLFLSSFEALRLGGRYYQQYYVALLPFFCVLTGIGVDFRNLRSLSRLVLYGSFGVLIGFHIFTTCHQFLDRNKNWDSQIRSLNQEILADTSPEETIWISHGLLPPYFATHRKPAVKNVYFHDALSHASVCRASEELLKENFDDPNYREVYSNLIERKPKVIFWVQRQVNTCADRLKLENFPVLNALIARDYRKKWSSNLGIYFIKKS